MIVQKVTGSEGDLERVHLILTLVKNLYLRIESLELSETWSIVRVPSQYLPKKISAKINDYEKSCNIY